MGTEDREPGKPYFISWVEKHKHDPGCPFAKYPYRRDSADVYRG